MALIDENYRPNMADKERYTDRLGIFEDASLIRTPISVLTLPESIKFISIFVLVLHSLPAKRQTPEFCKYSW